MPSSSPRKNIRVLFVTPEVFPLCKTGGLGDVSAALPVALRALKMDARLLLPGYPAVLAGLKSRRKVATFDLQPHFPPATLLSSRLQINESVSVPLYVIHCPALYQRTGGIYLDDTGQDWPDNAQRFGLLSKIGALLASDASPLAWVPDIVHCNDWQSGLTPAYLHFHSGKKAASLITLHNLAFQGNFPSDEVAKLGLPDESFSMHGAEFYGNLSFLKAGIYYADHISTVSPGYAREIQQEPLGFGLQGLLAKRSDDITGIVNGIDTAIWNPATDPYLVKKYTSRNLSAKAANKLALQQTMGLENNQAIPLFGTVSRLTHQKGSDIMLQVAPMLADLPAQLALLGSGDALLEQQLAALAQAFPTKIAVRIGYDEALSHLINAGTDCFLMPSRFEPCGLNQMYSQHYGTPPVVHATGGLMDTVVDLTPETLADKSASGFHFHEMTADSFMEGIKRAINAYHNTRLWKNLQRNGMQKDFSWQASASAYQSIYSLLMQKNRPASTA
ncbi:starch synthase [Nitrosomonas eutropha]|uniref:glycogen synthase GlgA n=1 Tax=Nitrosomonas TaxID=914 RepID=UPI000890F644|nr:MULTISPECIES: glycogen synthase GlgA [Nitrosomonas]MXS79774.1 glycogen synthase GlgA [Nitrosomonas sp. GH22]SCX04785.1 starch synthase [Nitrosomonas eutropha]SDW46522.1 starch synthase [Nitrosomonas eutropha]